LHTTQLMPLSLTVSSSVKSRLVFTFLVPAHPGSPGQRAVKWVCVCVYNCFDFCLTHLKLMSHFLMSKTRRASNPTEHVVCRINGDNGSHEITTHVIRSCVAVGSGQSPGGPLVQGSPTSRPKNLKKIIFRYSEN